MNECVPLAHGLACSAEAARLGAATRPRLSAPPLPGPVVFAGEGPTKTEVARRVFAESERGGPASLHRPRACWRPSPGGLHSAAGAAGGAECHRAKSDRRAAQSQQLVICQRSGFGPVEPPTSTAAAGLREGEGAVRSARAAIGRPTYDAYWLTCLTSRHPRLDHAPFTCPVMLND